MFFQTLETRRLMSGGPLGGIIVGPLPTAPLQPDPLLVEKGATRLYGTTLVANGGDAADRIDVRPGPSGYIEVVRGSLVTRFLTSAVQKISMLGYAGNDGLHVSTLLSIPATIDGGTGNDSVTGGSGADNLTGSFDLDVVSGNAGNDSLSGIDGNDYLNGGFGDDSMRGGAGHDTFVSLDDAMKDSLWGEDGNDSFWIDENYYPPTGNGTVGAWWRDPIYDATSRENSNNIHKIQRFSNGADRTLNGDNIFDPVDIGAKARFSNRPLFGPNGPHKDDIRQGNLGDCYFLATLGATAKISSDKIRQRVVDLGDGTYAVKMFDNGAKYYRVDADLPVYANSMIPRYAGLGHNQSLWVAIMEKVYTHHRRGLNDYASIESGWPSEVFPDLGSSSIAMTSSANGTDLLNYISSQQALNKAVTFATKYTVPSGIPLINNHVYMVERVNYAFVGLNLTPISVTLRNPWGYDGAGNDGNTSDAYVTITATQALNGFTGIDSAFVV
jgi:Ca2+-binding RTX toxin-like protein